MKSLNYQNTPTKQDIANNSIAKRKGGILPFLCLVFFFALFSCNKEIERCCDTGPGFAIYKTKADYFYYILKRSKGFYDLSPYCFKQNYSIDNDTTSIYRIRLEEDYILEYGPDKDGCFTNITWGEMLRYCDENTIPFTVDSVLERIIDNNPFIEYYYDKDQVLQPLSNQADLDRINEIICNGELKKYFKQVK
jgi:hypothetical protein